MKRQGEKMMMKKKKKKEKQKMKNDRMDDECNKINQTTFFLLIVRIFGFCFE